MDDQPLQLPYFAPQSRLPIPIPAVQDIERDAVVLHERDGRRVVRFGNDFVIKYGLDVSLTEGENMLFVRQTQPLLAPEVFALFSVENAEGGQVNYIIMENVVGDRLDQVWDRLDWEAAGWYPAYWEYVMSMFSWVEGKDDWHEYLARIMDEYPNEYVWFDMIRHELWY
ncbi:hypothetical protein E4U45_005420 [Claviceps purpurea]|nr:hypothetical protein E4U45_005420 [Claviceps purpurea]